MIVCVKEFVYEMEATSVCGRADVCEFLFEFVSRRCSGPTASSDTQSVGSELGLQHTLNTWNRYVRAHTHTHTAIRYDVSPLKPRQLP